MDEVPYYYWPNKTTGGLKIVNHTADKILGLKEIPTLFYFQTTDEIIFRTCEITPEIIEKFRHGNVTTETPAKPCYCDSQETYEKLIHDSDWNIPEGTVLPEKPAPKVSRRKKNA